VKLTLRYENGSFFTQQLNVAQSGTFFIVDLLESFVFIKPFFRLLFFDILEQAGVKVFR
jgi:hypothetical protein